MRWFGVPLAGGPIVSFLLAATPSRMAWSSTRLVCDMTHLVFLSKRLLTTTVSCGFRRLQNTGGPSGPPATCINTASQALLRTARRLGLRLACWRRGLRRRLLDGLRPARGPARLEAELHQRLAREAELPV